MTRSSFFASIIILNIHPDHEINKIQTGSEDFYPITRKQLSHILQIKQKKPNDITDAMDHSAL